MTTEITKFTPTFLPAPTTFEEAFRIAKVLAASDLVPKDYRGHPENCVVAMQWGADIGLPGLQALQNIAVINGRPSIWGDAAKALALSSPLCDDIEERVEGEGDDTTAVCIAKRKGKSPVEARFSVADAKKAGLWNKQGPWQQYPKRMLQLRARGFALRDAFPDILRGLVLAEEAQDYPVERDITPPAAAEVRPARSRTEAVRNRLRKRAPADAAPEAAVEGEAVVVDDAELVRGLLIRIGEADSREALGAVGREVNAFLAGDPDRKEHRPALMAAYAQRGREIESLAAAEEGEE